jgi:hypothetical protein
MKAVCFSTGNFYVPGTKRDINRQIKDSLKLDIDGIEILFNEMSSLKSFKLDHENKKNLRDLKFNLIHAPVSLNGNDRFFYTHTPSYKKIVSKMHSLYDEINAVNINFHSSNMKNLKLLKTKKYNYTFENVTPHWNFKIETYKNLLDKNKKIGFLLDSCHGLQTNQFELLYKTFKNRIKYVHISNLTKKMQHSCLHEASKKELERLNILKMLNVPFVIETWYKEKTNIALLRKEIKFLRNWLK